MKRINENVRDLMTGKSLNDIRDSLDDMSYPDVKKLLIKAIVKNEIEVVKLIIDAGVSIRNNIDNLRTCLTLDRPEILELLIKNGANVHSQWMEDYLDDYEGTKSYNVILKHQEITNESSIMKFNDFNNLEFRKGSLEHGDKVKQLIEFLRIYKDQNEDTMVFNKDDFEKASKMKISDIEEINNLPTKKNLMDFDIEITENQIKFTNLQNRKSVHAELLEILKLEDFLKNQK